jgi:hypothetical protein
MEVTSQTPTYLDFQTEDRCPSLFAATVLTAGRR